MAENLSLQQIDNYIQLEWNPLFSKDRYLYDEGDYNTKWQEGYNLDPSDDNKINIDDFNYLYIYAEGSSAFAEISVETIEEYDFTNIKEIKVEWENTGVESNSNQSALVVGSSNENLSNYEKRILRQDTFVRNTETLDVETLTGNHHIRLHARDNNDTAGISQQSELFVYRIILVYEFSEREYEIERKKDTNSYSLIATMTTSQSTVTYIDDKKFNDGSEYCYRVKDATETFDDFEESCLTFDLKSFVEEPHPLINANIDIGFTELSGLVSSRDNEFDVKIHISIADNELFDDSDDYETEFVASGERVGVEHVIKAPGTYWINMQAEDTEGNLSNELEYTITAELTLYYMDNPSINTQSRQATHITVRSETDEATANLANITDDEKIERLVEIEEGDQATCQEVAEKLLERWGRERKSVVGDVDLTVVTDFKEKIAIRILEAGLYEEEEEVYFIQGGSFASEGTSIRPEEFTLQKKEHDVTGSRTTLTVGDIILSDNELLARILDEIGV